MRLAQLQQPLKASAAAPFRLLLWGHRPALPRLGVDPGCSAVEGRRNASVKSQGAYKLTSKKTLPKKLGAKKTGG